jgi:coenzyme F420 hydrogenase subunit beta
MVRKMEIVHGLDELSRRVLEPGLCAACGACVGGCPYVTAFRGKTVMLDRCAVEHGRCFAYCPMTAFDPEEVSSYVFGLPHQSGGLGFTGTIVASRSKDLEIASLGQGGGTVTALMVKSLEDGFIDSAVLTGVNPKESYPHGVVALTVRDILACAGSKYVGAHSLSALREAIDRGFQRIGVVGLPCQVRSIRKMAMYDLKKEDLKKRIRVVLGLFCNWAFSSRDFISFLSERLNVNFIKKIHIPPPPANSLELETEIGFQSISLDDLRPMIQASCWNCPDMTSEFADISVGMYEGKPGWNTLITRTEIGQDLVRRAEEEGRLEIEIFPQANLEHLKAASLNKMKRASERQN